MSEDKNRPILNIDGQIKHLQSKGIKFDKMSAEEARHYLAENNNYFKLRAYRKNFPKHPDGPLVGQYINLDFAMLKDLAIIDMHLRYTLLQLALDVEHFAKVKLLQTIEQSCDDGYQIVLHYMSNLAAQDIKNNTNRRNTLDNEIDRNKNNPYCGGIIQKYDGHFPVWAFIEIVPLGTFIHFYKFCADYLQNKALEDDFFLLLGIKDLRNAAAHNNCIIHDMGAKDSTRKTNFRVLNAISSISKAKRKSKLSNVRMQQIITLLYAHSTLVTSKGVRETQKKSLNKLCERMQRHIDYYDGNDAIITSFDFIEKVVDILFKS